MNDTKAKPRFFAVTTPGLTATRWLTYVLASRPDVFVAHGKFALDSVSNGDFHKEQETASIDSLTRGNETRTFYEDHSLAEVHAAYQTIKPAAHAFGSVHSYTMHTLVQAAREPAALADLRIVNVVRHPVNLIASHYSLVRSAENHPPLYRTYVDEILPAVLQQFPELFLIGCPDYRAFLGLCRQLHDGQQLDSRSVLSERSPHQDGRVDDADSDAARFLRRPDGAALCTGSLGRICPQGADQSPSSNKRQHMPALDLCRLGPLAAGHGPHDPFWRRARLARRIGLRSLDAPRTRQAGRGKHELAGALPGGLPASHGRADTRIWRT